jgi:hypothetical protein
MKTCKGSEDRAPIILNFVTSYGGQLHAPAACPLEKYPGAN